MHISDVTHIDFTPCDGFGSTGRTATLLDSSGAVLAFGHGEDDREAVLEALIGEGYTFDAAFHWHGTVLSRATLRHHYALTPSN